LKLTTKNTSAGRGGTTLIELIAAAAILAVLIVVCSQMLSRTVTQQQAIAHRRAALQMASNAMERVQALAWNELTAAGMKPIAQAVVAQGMLRRSRIEVEIVQSEAAPPAKRISVTVFWAERSDQVERKQKLTAWRFAEENRNPSGAGEDRSSPSKEDP
jgi:Tfp pilus assembly protein PilE